MASKMYFIQSGVCEVESVGSRHPLKFMTKGGYFGEIGVLLTGKRTCSVVVRTTTILQAIKKEDLDDIL
jgi:CRP-like cAMP-binding protein